jgi:UDP-N-acetylglucosamine 2-epimerase
LKRKFLSIVGARPQFVKLGSLSNKLRKFHKEIIVHTGQHFDSEMSDLFFNQLEIPLPDYNMGIGGGSHGEQTGKMLILLEEICIKEKPDFIITFGDTNSTLAGSLTAAKLQIKSIHVEAGLRSFNRYMPEEINRVTADHVSDYLFAPTQTAMNNLRNENLSNRAFLTGDIMVDTHKSALLKIKSSEILNEHNLEPGKYYLLTLHRPYNVDEPENLSGILSEIGRLSHKVIFPVHPRTRAIIKNNKIHIPENLILIKPLGYLDFVILESEALKIITDSGGIQKEAYILKKPCITLRSETEWVETLESGWNLLINPNEETNYSRLIDSFNPDGKYENLFGVNVADKMIKIINEVSI